MSDYNQMQQIKRRFFAMRNGVVAEALRQGGVPNHIIFGLNLPQIKEIATEFEKSEELSRRLWADARTRESGMLAPYLWPFDSMDMTEALQWIATAPSYESIDILTLAVLRNQDYIPELFDRLVTFGDGKSQYSALRLYLATHHSDISQRAIALAREIVSGSQPHCRNIAFQILQELEPW